MTRPLKERHVSEAMNKPVPASPAQISDEPNTMESWLAVECPQCGAKPKYKCTSSVLGILVCTVHNARQASAIAARSRLEPVEVPKSGEREHKLGCDEYHQHQAPKCCSNTCWCKSDQDDSEILEVIGERDEWEDKATALAEAVGEYFGVPVGEHSSANCPIEEAHKILNGEYVTKVSTPLPQQEHIETGCTCSRGFANKSCTIHTPPALPQQEEPATNEPEPCVRLLADVMHLWVDGYISKNPNSLASSSTSSDKFEEIDKFLDSQGISVDYCGWEMRDPAPIAPLLEQEGLNGPTGQHWTGFIAELQEASDEFYANTTEGLRAQLTQALTSLAAARAEIERLKR